MCDFQIKKNSKNFLGRELSPPDAPCCNQKLKMNELSIMIACRSEILRPCILSYEKWESQPRGPLKFCGHTPFVPIHSQVVIRRETTHAILWMQMTWFNARATGIYLATDSLLAQPTAGADPARQRW